MRPILFASYSLNKYARFSLTASISSIRSKPRHRFAAQQHVKHGPIFRKFGNLLCKLGMMKLYVKPSQGHASASIYFSDFKYPELEAEIAIADGCQ